LLNAYFNHQLHDIVTYPQKKAMVFPNSTLSYEKLKQVFLGFVSEFASTTTLDIRTALLSELSATCGQDWALKREFFKVI